jgi:hypothetical protein
MITLREQMKICRANGNLIDCDVSKLDLYFLPSGLFLSEKAMEFHKTDTLAICVKHKCQCWGGACKEERNAV